MKTVVRIGMILLAAVPGLAQSVGSSSPRQQPSGSDIGVTAADIKALREAIDAQQKQLAEQQREIDWLRDEMRRRDEVLRKVQAWTAAAARSDAETLSTDGSGQAAGRSAPAAAPNHAADVATTAAHLAEGQTRVPAADGLRQRFRFTGDVRLRQEDAFLAGQQPRIRERIRLRLGIEGAVSEDFVAGIAVATGTLADPTTTNETLTNFFERKVIGFDRGYITYNPKAHKWISLTGGKFAYTWQRTGQTFDADLNPEGFSEKLSFDLKHAVMKNLTVTGMQLLFNENPNVKQGTSGADSFAAGGQIATRLQVRRISINPAYTLLNWRNANVILNAPAFTTGVPVTGNVGIVCAPVSLGGGGTFTPDCGFAVGPFAPNGLTNGYRIVGQDSRGNLVRQYASKFLYSDLIVDSMVDTGNARWPWRVLLEYENNLRAVTNASHAYLAETSLGQTREKGDVIFGYAFVRQEQDSIISSFGESDQRLPTNVLQHRVYAQVKLQKNVLAAYTLWVGRVLNTALFAPLANPFGPAGSFDRLQTGFLAPGVSPGETDRYLKRMQFDLTYTF